MLGIILVLGMIVVGLVVTAFYFSWSEENSRTKIEFEMGIVIERHGSQDNGEPKLFQLTKYEKYVKSGKVKNKQDYVVEVPSDYCATWAENYSHCKVFHSSGHVYDFVDREQKQVAAFLNKSKLDKIVEAAYDKQIGKIEDDLDNRIKSLEQTRNKAHALKARIAKPENVQHVALRSDDSELETEEKLEYVMVKLESQRKNPRNRG